MKNINSQYGVVLEASAAALTQGGPHGLLFDFFIGKKF